MSEKRSFHHEGFMSDMTITQATCAETLINQEGLPRDAKKRVALLVAQFSEKQPEFEDVLHELSDVINGSDAHVTYFQDGIVAVYYVLLAQLERARTSPLDFNEDVLHITLLQTALDHKKYDMGVNDYLEDIKEALRTHNEYMMEYIEWCTKREEYAKSEEAKIAFMCGALLMVGALYHHGLIHDLGTRYITRN